MAFSWHRQENSFSRHPKTGELAAALNDKNAGMYVIRFWEWIGTYAPRGQFKRSLTEHIERWCEWLTEPGKLLETLILVGFVDELADGTLEAHDWWEHQQSVVEKAEKDAARKRRERRRKRAGESGDASADEHRDGAGTPQDGRTDETDGRDGRDTTPPTPVAAVVVEEIWERFQKERDDFEILRLNERPANFAQWLAGALVACPDGPDQLVYAWALYLKDKTFRAERWPLRKFMHENIWRPRVPLKARSA